MKSRLLAIGGTLLVACQSAAGETGVRARTLNTTPAEAGSASAIVTVATQADVEHKLSQARQMRRFAQDEIVIRFHPAFARIADRAHRAGTLVDTLTQHFPALASLHIARTKRFFVADDVADGDTSSAFSRAVRRIRHRNRHVGAAPEPPDLSSIYRIWVTPGTNIEALCRKLQSDTERILYAEPNSTVQTSLPNDIYVDPDGDGKWAAGAWGQSFADLWGMRAIQANHAWQNGAGGTDIIVAVIDTGIDYNHEDVLANMWFNPGELQGDGLDNDHNGYADDTLGFDFCTYDQVRDSDPLDDNGHGTHVAGTIAATIDNAAGVAGLAPQVKLMALKAIGRSGIGYDTDLAEAIVYAVNNGARVLNNSWSGVGSSSLVRDSIRFAHSLGCVCVAAAGNVSMDVANFYPANLDGTIAVAATDILDQRATFSNYGSLLDIAAPGVDILSLRAAETLMTGDEEHLVPVGNVFAKYLRASGTSMACPHVSGLAAVLLSLRPYLSNEQTRQILRGAADDIGTTGFDAFTGAGRLNVPRALNLESVPDVWLDPVADSDTIFGPTVIRGTAGGVDFAAYSLQYGSLLTGQLQLIHHSTSPVVEGELAAPWFPELVSGDNQYDLVLTVTTTGGVQYLHVRRVVAPVIALSNPRGGELISGNDPIVIVGTANHPSPDFHYDLEYMHDSSATWSSEGISLVNEGITPVHANTLGYLDPRKLSGSGLYSLALTVHQNGVEVRVAKSFYLDLQITAGFPKGIEAYALLGPSITMTLLEAPTVADIDGDGRHDLSFVYGDAHAFNGQADYLPNWPFRLSEHDSFFQQYAGPVYPDEDLPGKRGVLAGGFYYNLYKIDSLAALKPGFPRSVRTTRSAIADIDGDGIYEIVSTSLAGNEIAIYDRNGDLKDGWPRFIDGLIFAGPSVGNIDGDRGSEIVVTYADSKKARIVALDANGAVVPGWPVELHTRDTATIRAVLGDLDRDGADEVLVSEFALDILHVLKEDGAEWAGAPFSFDGELIWSAPTIADLDGDGFPEVLIGTQGQSHSRIHIWNHEGVLAGWPRNVGEVGTNSGVPIAVGDVAGGDELEIVAAGSNDWLYVLQVDGEPVQGFPRYKGGGPSHATCSPALADIDGDGLVEICQMAFAIYTDPFEVKNLLVAWDTDRPYSSSRMEWPMFASDPGQTSRYRRSTPLSDVDRDGDVDEVDFIRFQACNLGPEIPRATSTDCTRVDFNLDARVDLNDFRRIQNCFGGENATVTCGW